MEKFAVENDKYRDSELGAANVWKKYVPLFELFSNILTLVLMLVGGIMVVNGQMTMGDLVAVNGYLWMLTMPLRMAGWLINDMQRFTTSVEKSTIHISLSRMLRSRLILYTARNLMEMSNLSMFRIRQMMRTFFTI